MLTRYRKPRPSSKTYLTAVMTVMFILLVFMCSEDYSALAIQGEGITYVNCAIDNGQYVYAMKLNKKFKAIVGQTLMVQWAKILKA